MVGRLVSGPVAAVLLAGLGSPAIASRPARAPAQQAAAVAAGKVRLWVSNDDSGTVLPVNPVTGRAGRPVRVRHPFALVMTPDGRALYVLGVHTVTPVRTADGRLGKPDPVARFPGWTVAAPDSKAVYVAAQNTVVPIRVATGKAARPVVVAKRGDGSEGLAIAPDGRTLFAVTGRAVRPVSTVTNRAGPPIRTPLLAGPMVILPDGRTGYALGVLGIVIPINLAAGTTRRPIKVGNRLRSDPQALALLPDGSTLYVADSGTGTVVPVSVTRDRAGPPVKVGHDPFALAVTPSGRTLYVLASHHVTPIRTATNTAGQPVRVPFIPTSFAITPDGRTLWVAGYTQRTGGAVQGFVMAIRTATNKPGNAIKTGKGFPCLVIKPWHTSHAHGPSSCG